MLSASIEAIHVEERAKEKESEDRTADERENEEERCHGCIWFDCCLIVRIHYNIWHRS